VAKLQIHISDRDRICKICSEGIKRDELAAMMTHLHISPTTVKIHFHLDCLAKEYGSLRRMVRCLKKAGNSKS
jgi:hypothetical protein